MRLLTSLVKCVIIATRPLLLSVLKGRMESLDRPEEEWQDFLVVPRNLISIGIRSAVKSLEIISDDDILLGKISCCFKHWLV